MNSKKLTYILTEERGVVSFDPLHSDTLLNLTFEEQIVGTLVKFNNRGYIEPFLAETWEAVDSHSRIWNFKIREGITCEDGTPITATAFVSSFTNLLKQYTKNNKQIPAFERLRGFENFKKHNGALDGLQVINGGRTVQFIFETKPDALLEFLSMPYYGFHCSANFDSQGLWKNPQRVISSGAYKLMPSKNTNVLKLEKRQDWFSHAPDSPSEVDVLMLPFDEAQKLKPQNTIIQRRVQNHMDLIEGYKRFLSTPTDLMAIVLSPKRLESPFKNEVKRQEFRDILRKSENDVLLESEISKTTRSFFQNITLTNLKTQKLTESKSTLVLSQSTLKVVVSNALSETNRNYVIQLLNIAARQFGYVLSIQGEDRSQPGWKERLDELVDFDIRVVRVDIGSSYNIGAVNMMFCSRLGVSFPDPSGEVCKHVQRVVLTEKEPTSSEAEEFERIVYNDAAVIPILHTSHSWLISNDINLSQFSPTSNFMRFDLISLK